MHNLPFTAALSRRRFVQGVGAALLAGGTQAGPRAGALSTLPELAGREFDLTIAPLPVNYTGAPALATAVNGSVPAPLLRWRQGDDIVLRVTNRLDVPTSLHWHGILLPAAMDGVPGLSFPGIAPGETFIYRFRALQAGTYWYHSHSGFQEQTGLYGPLVIEPQHGEAIAADRDYVLMLNDWTDQRPERIFQRLKADSDYYNRQRPTLGDLARDVGAMGLAAAWERRRMWSRMRMNPTDLQDVSASAYTYLVNGATPEANWTAIAHAGERVRLRLINGAASTYFDVRIPGLKMTVIAADGQAVAPVEVDELRLAVAETYDVLVRMPDDRAYTVFCQSMDRTGHARATLAPAAGMEAAVPPLDARTWLEMTDMGMAGGDMAHSGHGMPGMAMAHAGADKPSRDAAPMAGHPSMEGMSGMSGQTMEHTRPSGHDGMHGTHGTAMHGAGKGMAPGGTSVEVDMRVATPSAALDDPGPRLRGNGRRVLTYADLRTLGGAHDPRPAGREIVLHLTGNMQRFVWGFDGVKYNEAEPIRLDQGERVRFVLVNDTMMNHPIHLHGMFSEVENPDGAFQVRKHTVNVQPGKRVSFLVSADAPGEWAFHCHLLYHMEAGMFRKVVVA